MPKEHEYDPDKLDMRHKLTREETQQFWEDVEVIQSLLGVMPRKTLLLLAVHRLAERIRAWTN